MKKIIAVLLFLSCLLYMQSAFSQDLLSLEDHNTVAADDMVTQHNDIELVLGNLKIEAIFLYQTEKAPYQGYLIRFKDFVKIETLISNYASGCAIVVDELTKQCKSDLTICRKECDSRVKDLITEKDHLEQSLDAVSKDLIAETNKKVLWSTLSGVAGVGIGVLIFNIVN